MVLVISTVPVAVRVPPIVTLVPDRVTSATVILFTPEPTETVSAEEFSVTDSEAPKVTEEVLAAVILPEVEIERAEGLDARYKVPPLSI